MAATVVLVLISAGQAQPDAARAGDNGLHWGDWDCSGGAGSASAPALIPEVVDANDFLAVMRFLAELQPVENLPPGCPTLGETIEVAEFLTLVWGDIDCDGFVDADDAVILLLHLAGILPEDFLDCPEIGEVLDFVLGFADFKAQAMSASFLAASAGQVGPRFFNFPVLMSITFLIHNNGPNPAAAEVYWSIQQLQGGDMFYRLLAKPGDVCLGDNDQQIPCGEGGPRDRGG